MNSKFSAFAGILLFLPFTSQAQSSALATLPVNSPAFVFSPGNWTGDTGRAGSAYRQTWYPGAYFRVNWTSPTATSTAELLFDTSPFGNVVKKPILLTYCLDGVWTSGVKVEPSITLKVTGAGAHTLAVYFSTSQQIERWGTPAESGRNVVRLTGLRLPRDSTFAPAAPPKPWVLIVGDSITEGSAANNGQSDNLAAWSYFVGEGLQALGYEYGVSACGYSGWIRPGGEKGDVPPYYLVAGSQNGLGGTYSDARSRWNKIDARHGLLDSKKRLSAYGSTGQEPAAIFLNFGTNDNPPRANASDTQASITQALLALQSAAPVAQIFVIVPFGQYAAKELKAGVAACHAANPTGRKISLIDLGPAVAKGLAANGYWSGLHPNMRGHATFAAEILAKALPLLPPPSAGRTP